MCRVHDGNFQTLKKLLNFINKFNLENKVENTVLLMIVTSKQN